MEVGEGLLQVEPTRLEEGPLPRVVGLPVPRVEEGGGAVLGEAKLHLLARIAAMELTLLDKLSGTLANAATVALGTGLGLVLREGFPSGWPGSWCKGWGSPPSSSASPWPRPWGRRRAGRWTGWSWGLSPWSWGLLGEWARLEEGLEGLGERIKRAVRGGGSFTEGFVAASLLFCVGPMTLLGAIQNGLTGDASLLFLKATLDGLSAIALTSSFGVGVGFSVLVILLYQGAWPSWQAP